MKPLFIKIIIIFLLSVNIANCHKFYLTVADIKYNENKHSTKLIFKFFLDDLENSIQDKYDTKIWLATKKQIEDANDYVNKYVNSNFKLTINGAVQILEFEKTEIPSGVGNTSKYGLPESIWIYYDLSNSEKIKSAEIQSDLLFKLFEGNNIVCNIKNGSDMKTIVLNSRNRSGEKDFD